MVIQVFPLLLFVFQPTHTFLICAPVRLYKTRRLKAFCSLAPCIPLGTAGRLLFVLNILLLFLFLFIFACGRALEPLGRQAQRRIPGGQGPLRALFAIFRPPDIVCERWVVQVYRALL